MTRRLVLALFALGLGLGIALTLASSDARSDDGLAAMRSASITMAALAERAASCPDGTPATALPFPPRCAHFVYVWSPSMPLSVRGLPEIRAAAAALGVPLSAVQAEGVVEPVGDPVAEALRTSLVHAGATVHYPAVVIMTGGAVRSHAVVGYKQAAAYRSMLRERLTAAAPASRHDPPGPPDDTTASAAQPDIELLWTHAVEPPPGAFFRRIPGTSYIAFDQRSTVHLRDLTTGAQFTGPGWIDFVPTPEGRLFVTPGRNNSGLQFYHARDVMEQGPAGTAATLSPLVVDREMNDQYPSVGILEEEEGRTRYRILVSWFRGLAFRDYDVHWSEEGPPRIEALTEKRAACPGHDLSTPILSKDGHEIAARHDESGTTRIYRLSDDASCTEVLDLGRQTSKVGFNDDGTLVAYSSPEPVRMSSGTRSWTYVLDRESGATVRVPHTESAGLVIPELVGADSILVAVKEEARSRGSEFRLLCCVR